MTLKIYIKEFYINPVLIITFISNVSTGCSNSSIFKCKCPFKWHSSRKCFFEIVRHASGILSKASVSIFEHWRQYVKGKWKESSLGDPKSGFCTPLALYKRNYWFLLLRYSLRHIKLTECAWWMGNGHAGALIYFWLVSSITFSV